MARTDDALIAVEAATVPAEHRSRAQEIATLFAWCGGGDLTPNQVHAYLREDGSPPRARAVGVLIEAGDGEGYLATACHVLSERAGAEPLPVFALDLPDAALSEPGLPETDQPIASMTEITLDPRVRRARDGRSWFPAMSFPHLDLAIVHLGEAASEPCVALREAGFTFLPLERIGREPSREGAAVALPRPRAASRGAGGEPAAEARVAGLSDHLSFFWVDRPALPDSGAAPVLEGDELVGFLSPRTGVSDAGASDGGSVESPHAAAVKAVFLRRLLDALAPEPGRADRKVGTRSLAS